MEEVLFSLVVLFLLANVSTHPTVSDVGYVVVFDAGSSGTRSFVYKWLITPSSNTRASSASASYTSKCTSSLEIVQVASEKIKPGLAEYVDNLDDLEDYLAPLLKQVIEEVPDEFLVETPIYIMATGGMRLLSAQGGQAIMERIEDYLLNHDVNPFRFDVNHARVLSGGEEGVFSWLSVNYMRGYFDGKVTHPVGVLEMGGASTQITFLPHVDVLAGKFPVRVGAVEYPLYSHSFLTYGQQHAKQWMQEYLVRTGLQHGDNSVNDPCSLQGDTVTDDINGQVRIFQGTGDPDACENVLNKLVHTMDDHFCYPKPCSIGSIYQPDFVETKEFYAISAFQHTLTVLNVTDEDGYFTPRRTREAAVKYCKETIEVAAIKYSVPREYLSVYCMSGLYIPILLTKGYGFADDSQQVKLVTDVNGQQITWCLGAALYELEKTSQRCSHEAASRHVINSSSGSNYNYLKNDTILSYMVASLLIISLATRPHPIGRPDFI